MFDPRLIAHLQDRNIAFCLIGGVALSAWGVARYTPDARAFWAKASAF